jgi:hypothetical protein
LELNQGGLKTNITELLQDGLKTNAVELSQGGLKANTLELNQDGLYSAGNLNPVSPEREILLKSVTGPSKSYKIFIQKIRRVYVPTN